MPIVDVRPVVIAPTAATGLLTQALAEAIAKVLGASRGRVWVRLHELAAERYAENGGRDEASDLPVFVEVLHADWPDQTTMAREAMTLAAAIASCLGCSTERVHIEYVPPGRGRIAFGGKLLV